MRNLFSQVLTICKNKVYCFILLHLFAYFIRINKYELLVLLLLQCVGVICSIKEVYFWKKRKDLISVQRTFADKVSLEKVKGSNYAQYDYAYMIL